MWWSNNQSTINLAFTSLQYTKKYPTTSMLSTTLKTLPHVAVHPLQIEIISLVAKCKCMHHQEEPRRHHLLSNHQIVLLMLINWSEKNHHACQQTSQTNTTIRTVGVDCCVCRWQTIFCCTGCSLTEGLVHPWICGKQSSRKPKQPCFRIWPWRVAKNGKPQLVST